MTTTYQDAASTKHEPDDAIYVRLTPEQIRAGIVTVWSDEIVRLKVRRDIARMLKKI
jgi:hypothetical protein